MDGGETCENRPSAHIDNPFARAHAVTTSSRAENAETTPSSTQLQRTGRRSTPTTRLASYSLSGHAQRIAALARAPRPAASPQTITPPKAGSSSGSGSAVTPTSASSKVRGTPTRLFTASSPLPPPRRVPRKPAVPVQARAPASLGGGSASSPTLSADAPAESHHMGSCVVAGGCGSVRRDERSPRKPKLDTGRFVATSSPVVRKPATPKLRRRRRGRADPVALYCNTESKRNQVNHRFGPGMWGMCPATHCPCMRAHPLVPLRIWGGASLGPSQAPGHAPGPERVDAEPERRPRRRASSEERRSSCMEIGEASVRSHTYSAAARAGDRQEAADA